MSKGRKIRNPKVNHFPKMMPLRMSTEMYAKITAAAVRRGWDRSKLVRFALSGFLATDESEGSQE